MKIHQQSKEVWQKAKRGAVEYHEAECGYRDVPCIVATCPKYIKFKDYGEHIFEHHSITKRPVWVFNRRQRRKGTEISEGSLQLGSLLI